MNLLTLVASSFASLALAGGALAQEPVGQQGGAQEDAPAGATPTQPGPRATPRGTGDYLYFYRAGATLEEQHADLDACRPIVMAMTPSGGSGSYNDPVTQSVVNQNIAQYGGAGAIGSVIGLAIVAGIELETARLRAAHGNYENCMVVRGWQVVELEPGIGRELDGLSDRALAERLRTMVGGDLQGTVVRTFANEVDLAAPHDVDITSLSLQTMPRAFNRRPRQPPRPGTSTEERRERIQRERDAEAAIEVLWRGRLAVEPIELSAIETLPPEAAIVIVGTERAAPLFVRVGGNESGPDVFAGQPASMDKDKDEPQTEAPSRFSIFVVSPGRWRLTTFGGATSFCLGAPSFEIAAGEVLYIGTWTSSLPAPDMTLDAPRDLLASAPMVAERLRAAAYVNGDTFECGGGAGFPYAHDVQGAPFVEGYAWGSRAVAAEGPIPASTPASAESGVQVGPSEPSSPASGTVAP